MTDAIFAAVGRWTEPADGPLYARPDWHATAACRGRVDVMFPPPARVSRLSPTSEAEEAAKAICARCPEETRAACLDFALSTGQEFGVWGGKGEGERRKLMRSLRLATPLLCRRCGTEFTPVPPSARYCPSCRSKAHADRQRKYRRQGAE